MKRIALSFLAITGLLVSCSSDDDNSNAEMNIQYIVDKIYDYNNNLLAEYFYNDNDQLIKFDRVFNEELLATYEFDYQNGSIFQIDYENFEMPSFNHSIYLFYNQEERLIKDEMHQSGNIIEINEYTYNENGEIQEVESQSEGLNTISIYNYFDSENIEQVIRRFPEFDDGGNPTGNSIEIRFEYEYDQGLKPNFGIGNIFQIEPLPAFGTEAMFAKNMSANNMTRNLSTGTQWIYTYNENNLVETIEIIWEGVETEEPLLLNIVYKELN